MTLKFVEVELPLKAWEAFHPRKEARENLFFEKRLICYLERTTMWQERGNVGSSRNEFQFRECPVEDHRKVFMSGMVSAIVVLG